MGKRSFDDSYSVTMFSFTNELLLADKSPLTLAQDLLESGLSKNIEVDGPQHFRKFPNADPSEVAGLRRAIDSLKGSCSLLGGYADRAQGNRLVGSPEVVSSVSRQIEIAHQLGAFGLRVQADALTAAEAKELAKLAEESNVHILFELQGSMTPDSPTTEACLDVVSQVGSEYVGIMFDSSLFMTSFPGPLKRTMLQRGLPSASVVELEHRWLDSSLPDYRNWVLTQLKDGKLPPSTGQFLPTLFSRMGHSAPSEWSHVAGSIRSVQLKFWDQEDEAGELQKATTELMRLLRSAEYDGFYCSEWGGHEWYSLGDVSALDAVRWHRSVVEKSWIESHLGESNS